MTDWVLLWPELAVSAAALALLMVEAAYRGEPRRLTTWIALGGIGTAIVEMMAARLWGGMSVQGASISLDGVAFLCRALLYGLCAASVVAVAWSRGVETHRKTEVLIVLLAATAGGSFVAFSHNLILTFAGLLLLQLCALLMVAHGADREKSTTAMSSLFSFFFVANLSLMVALAAFQQQLGTLDLRDLAEKSALIALPSSMIPLIVLIFFLAAGCCLAVFPMYFWMQEAMSGVPAPMAVFLSTFLPVAGISMMLRVVLALGTSAVFTSSIGFQNVLLVSGTLSILVGSWMALQQTSVRRSLGWLTVSQSGFWVLSLVSPTEKSVVALLFGVVLHSLAALGGVLSIAWLSDVQKGERFEDLRGAFRSDPVIAFSALSFFLCLSAAPPFAPFIGRFATFAALVEGGQALAAGAGVVGWCLSLATVGRLACALAGDSRHPARTSKDRAFVLGTLALAPLAATVFAEPVYAWVLRSIRLILW